MADSIPSTMRVVRFHDAGGPDVLVDDELPVPTPGERDLLVEVRAVSVNPVDTKIRQGAIPVDDPKVLGYDAAGVVVATGGGTELFREGDEVAYSGSLLRPGTNAQYHLVDERLVGPKPTSLSFAEAAALPLTAITAWESLVEKFGAGGETTGTLLVMGGAGGVGSVLIQLARELTGLTVVATASQDESRQFASGMGAHHVVDHSGDLAAAVAEVAPDGVDMIFSPFTAGMVETYESMLRPHGQVVAIDEPEGLDLLPLKTKSISFHWELMFTRPIAGGPAMLAQHDILERVAGLVDDGRVRTTLTRTLSGTDAATLRRAHEMVEDGHMVGKVVLTAD